MKILLTVLLFSTAALGTDFHIGDISSYNGQTQSSGVRIWTPKNIAEIQLAVEQARKSHTQLKVKAASHSTSSLILSDGDYLSTQNLTGIISIQDMSVKVKAGTKLGDLAEELSKKGYSLGFGYPAFKGLTIGGLLATGAHGSSRRHIGISSQNILEMTLIDGQGNIRNLTSADKDAFRAAQVHLGLLGVVHDITLRIYPDFKLKYRFEQIPDFLNSKGQVQFGPEADSEIVMWSPVANTAVKYAGFITELPESPLAANHLLGDSNEVNLINDSAAVLGLGLGQVSSWVNAQLEANRINDVYQSPFILQDQSVQNEKVSYVGRSSKILLSEFFQPNVAFKHMELEFAFPLSEADAVLSTVREIAVREKLHFPISRGLFMRFGKSAGEQGPLMSHAERPNSPSQVWVFVSIVDYLSITQKTHGSWSQSRDRFIQELTQKHKLLLHWGKNSDQIFNWFNPPKVLGLQLDLFKKQVLAFDPDGVFSNQFSKSLGLTQPKPKRH
jgi:FAD/FMN-containing dehydrogenase